jgi:hypothetical protein
VATASQASELHGKALVQGLKIDSAGTMYVSTARLGGPDIPATLSRLVPGENGYALEPFPSAELNAVDDPQGLKAVLGFEIDRNDVMWMGHVAGQPSAPGDEKLVLWDIKAGKEVKHFVFGAEHSDKTCSFDIVVDNDSGFALHNPQRHLLRSARRGLIVYDSRNNTARRVLDATLFTNDDPNFFFNIGDRPVLKNGRMRTGADGIALSGDKRTL